MSRCQFGKKLGSPDWNLFAEVATVSPPDHLDQADLTEFPVRRFDNLSRQFHDAVNLYESLRYQDDRAARVGIYGSRMH